MTAAFSYILSSMILHFIESYVSIFKALNGYDWAVRNLFNVKERAGCWDPLTANNRAFPRELPLEVTVEWAG